MSARPAHGVIEKLGPAGNLAALVFRCGGNTYRVTWNTDATPLKAKLERQVVDALGVAAWVDTIDNETARMLAYALEEVRP